MNRYEYCTEQKKMYKVCDVMEEEKSIRYVLWLDINIFKKDLSSDTQSNRL